MQSFSILSCMKKSLWNGNPISPNPDSADPNHCCWKMFLVVLTPKTFLSSSVREFLGIKVGIYAQQFWKFAFCPLPEMSEWSSNHQFLGDVWWTISRLYLWSGQCFVVHVISLISAGILQQSLCMFVMHMYDIRTCTYAKYLRCGYVFSSHTHMRRATCKVWTK